LARGWTTEIGDLRQLSRYSDWLRAGGEGLGACDSSLGIAIGYGVDDRFGSWDSSVGIATGYLLEDRDWGAGIVQSVWRWVAGIAQSV
jgi:hypothetical protein